MSRLACARGPRRARTIPEGLGVTVDGLEGAALWSAPGRALSPTLWQSLRMMAGHLRLLLRGSAVKALRASSEMDSHHPDEPHLHLVILGVDPHRQGSGVVSALLEDGLHRADAARLPVYLDTANPDNLAYYSRFGFEVTCEFDITFGRPHSWGMLRRG